MSERVIAGCDAVHPDRRGGQHVARRCTGVLVIDDDRGVGVLINSERSQHANIERARKVLDNLLHDRNRDGRGCDDSALARRHLEIAERQRDAYRSIATRLLALAEGLAEDALEYGDSREVVAQLAREMRGVE